MKEKKPLDVASSKATMLGTGRPKHESSATAETVPPRHRHPDDPFPIQVALPVAPDLTPAPPPPKPRHVVEEPGLPSLGYHQEGLTQLPTRAQLANRKGLVGAATTEPGHQREGQSTAPAQKTSAQHGTLMFLLIVFSVGMLAGPLWILYRFLRPSH